MPSSDKREWDRPLTMTVAALGGQGGGVVTSWLVSVAERENFHVQATSVPGVAQRTGATIYYLEFFPRSEKGGRRPIMSLMPAAGGSDVVVASELVEAVRMVQRGIVDPDNTTLIASTHRIYTIGEKAILGDGRTDEAELLEVAQKSSKRFVAVDMAAIADEKGAIISSAILGAIAGSNVLPFSADRYREAIREGGKAVSTNLAAFDAAFLAAQQEAVSADAPEAPAPLVPSNLQERIADYPPALRSLLKTCVARVVDYQDEAYGGHFLDEMDQIAVLDDEASDFRLFRATAAGLALWMCFEDTIRVADLKTRPERFERLRQEAQLKPGEVMRVTEFLKPRVEELCGTLPRRRALQLLGSPRAVKFLGLFTGSRKLRTTSITGFLMLRLVAAMKRLRRGSLRYYEEHEGIRTWLEFIKEHASNDYELCCEVADSQQLVSGYGETHARGKQQFDALMSLANECVGQADGAARVRAHRERALGEPEDTPEFLKQVA